MARRADLQFMSRGLDFPAPSREARARNGAYRGPARVRELPPGVCGADLARAREVRMRAGQVWLRGPQRVRITRLTQRDVWFRELSYGHSLRHAPRWFFLTESVPEQALGRDDGRDE